MLCGESRCRSPHRDKFRKWKYNSHVQEINKVTSPLNVARPMLFSVTCTNLSMQFFGCSRWASSQVCLVTPAAMFDVVSASQINITKLIWYCNLSFAGNYNLYLTDIIISHLTSPPPLSLSLSLLRLAFAHPSHFFHLSSSSSPPPPRHRKKIITLTHTHTHRYASVFCFFFFRFSLICAPPHTQTHFLFSVCALVIACSCDRLLSTTLPPPFFFFFVAITIYFSIYICLPPSSFSLAILSFTPFPLSFSFPPPLFPNSCLQLSASLVLALLFLSSPVPVWSLNRYWLVYYLKISMLPLPNRTIVHDQLLCAI